MRADLITGDFINPTGSSAYLDQGPDTMLFKISLFNSHNGSLAVRVVTSYERLICMNGITRPDFSAGVYGRHTKGFSIQTAEAKIMAAMKGMHEDADRFGLWAKQRLSPKQAEEMLQMTVARLPNKPNGDPNFSEPLVNKILTQFKNEDQTVWGLFQAVTHWQTHGDRRDGADAIKTTISREKKVADMLKNPYWNRIAA